MTIPRINPPTLKHRSKSLETLISQLYACYQEYYRSDRIVIDHLASRALPEILSQYSTPTPPPERVTQLTSVIRTRWFDQQIVNFIEQFPNAIIVNVGAGLSTRYWRLPTVHPHWYEVDQTDVMQLRQTYFTIVPRDQDIEADVRDHVWLSQIKREPNQPILFVMEGVCMYLSPAENQALFKAIAHNFDEAYLLFDGVSPRFVEAETAHLAKANPGETTDYSSNFLGDAQRKLTWGLKNTNEFKTWGLSFNLIEEINYLLNIRDYPERLDPWMKNFWPILEPFLKDAARILFLKLN